MDDSLATIAERALLAISKEERISIREMLHAPNLPDAVAAMLRMEIERTVADDLRLAFKMHALTPSPADLRSNLDQLLDTGSLSRSDAQTLLEGAYELASQYLTEPQKFLLMLLAGELNEVSIDDEFFTALSFLREYSYFQDLLQTWAHRSINADVHSVTRSELKAKLFAIDSEVTGVLTADHMGLLLAPLFALFGEDQLPKDRLISFFQDKRSARVVRALREDLRIRIAIADIVALIRDEMKRVIGSATTEAGGLVSASLEARPQYDQFVNELRQAGILIGAPAAPALLEQIASRAVNS